MTLGGGIKPDHNIASGSHHQEAIQFRAIENVIDRPQVGLEPRPHGPLDLQAYTLVVESELKQPIIT